MGYYIGFVFGFFSIYLISIVIAAIVGYFMKNGTVAWIIYAIGALLTFFSLIGNSRFFNGVVMMLWVVYIVITFVAVIIINKCVEHY